MSKNRRLGRGLSALLGTDAPDKSPPADEAVPESRPVARSSKPASTDAARRVDPPSATPSPKPKIAATRQPPESASPILSKQPGDVELLLSVNLIEVNPFQPRKEFGESEIASLAESLKEHDLLQPVLVRRVGKKYQLISGERRLRAARLAGWRKIPARLREADDRLVAELAIVENWQRKDLNPIEKALSFKRYLDEHNCRQEDLGDRLKINRSTIANLLRLLELPAEVQRALQQGAITQGHARALLPLGDRREQIQSCKRIGSEGLSVRAIERMVSEQTRQDDGPTIKRSTAKQNRNAQIGSMEKELQRSLGTKVEIKTASAGRGKFVVHFKNHKEFERLQAFLMDEQQGRRRARA